MNRKKTGAILLGLTMGLTGTAFAAPAEEGDISARIAAIEAQQQQLAAQLEALKAENSKLKAEKAETDNKVNEVKKEQDRVKVYGFVRASWDKDTARGQAAAWRDEKETSRYYLNLMGDLKINDEWTGHFQSETNQRFAHSTTDGKLKKEDGQIQRIWLSGNLKNGLQINAGRKWSPLGMQFSLIGCTTSGIDVSYPITKQGLRAGAFYYAMAEYPEADFSMYGPTLSGPIGHNFDINIAYAKLNKGRTEIINKAWGATEKNPYGDQAFVISGATNVAKNLRLTADYVQTNHKADPGHDDENRAYLARLDYKWTNPSVVGSFGAYLRYHNIQAHGNIWADDAWGSLLKNSRGWTIGFKYVPWKNIEWETFYQISECNMSPWQATGTTSGENRFTRNLIRTQLDYHF
ncbi:hypothetical protein SAMN02910356_02242 [Selenomonas sp. GACV-9]|uniref:hypothetical protein n=1 Tax=Selenomonas sp. GACV-9 TaxID=3158782 RepID=UPI0008DEBCAA|nr:hypothetical protein SAMN02910356_02242 [Selenomonas ruminantium]